MDFANLYLNLILAERHWSWALIGIFYLGFTLLSRLLVFRRIVRETKRLDPPLYSAVQQRYLKHSVVGWILFSISFLLVIAFWVGGDSFANERGSLALFCLLLSLLFFLSLILHLTAFAEALLAILRQRMEVEREF